MLAEYLIDANLPYYFSIWNNSRFVHLKDINDALTDSEVWDYALKNNMTIITKDSDFSNRILLKKPPPKVIHIRIGNLNMKWFHAIIANQWKDIEEFNKTYKLVNVYPDHIEGIS